LIGVARLKLYFFPLLTAAHSQASEFAEFAHVCAVPTLTSDRRAIKNGSSRCHPMAEIQTRRRQFVVRRNRKNQAEIPTNKEKGNSFVRRNRKNISKERKMATSPSRAQT